MCLVLLGFRVSPVMTTSIPLRIDDKTISQRRRIVKRFLREREEASRPPRTRGERGSCKGGRNVVKYRRDARRGGKSRRKGSGDVKIEEEVFAGYVIDPARLPEAGFREEGGALVRETDLSAPGLTLFVRFDGAFSVTVWDRALGEPYESFRIENAVGFAAAVREEVEEILVALRGAVCEKLHFKTPQARRTDRFVTETFGASPEFLWARFPGYGVYRVPGGEKWFAFIGPVARNKVDRSSEDAREIEVLNLKAGPDGAEPLLARPGIYPAYHMNKKTWFSVILDDALPDEAVFGLIRASFRAVSEKER